MNDDLILITTQVANKTGQPVHLNITPDEEYITYEFICKDSKGIKHSCNIGILAGIDHNLSDFYNCIKDILSYVT